MPKKQYKKIVFSMNKTFLIFLLSLTVFSLSISSVLAFDFYGYTKNATGGVLNNTNVTLQIWNFTDWSIAATYSDLSDGNGFFNISSIEEYSGNYGYKPIIAHYNGNDADYVGKPLPEFPLYEFKNASQNATFYLQEGATINLTIIADDIALDDMNVTESNPGALNTDIQGLEWTGKLWAYINENSPDTIVYLNSDYSLNKTVNMGQDMNDLDYVSDTEWYVVNDTHALLWNGTNTSFDSSWDLSAWFSEISTIEYNPDNDKIYVAGFDNGLNSLIVKFNTSFSYEANFTPVPDDIEFIEYADGTWYTITFSLGSYTLRKCSGEFNDCNYPTWDFPDDAYGLEYISSTEQWYYTNNTHINKIDLYRERGFDYIIKDTKLGYEVSEYFSMDNNDVTIYSALIDVPENRNYSIIVFPEESMPTTYHLNNLTDYGGHADIAINTSEDFVWVSGYVKTNTGGADFTSLEIVPFILEPGNIIHSMSLMPYNMSSWREGGYSDIINLTTGFYNITLISKSNGLDAMLLFVAYDSSNDDTDYIMYQNITLTGSGDRELNVTVYPVIGNYSNNFTLQNFNGPNHVVDTVEYEFDLVNSSNDSIQNPAFVDLTLDYSNLGGTEFGWMIDIGRSDNGVFTIPLINNTDVKKIEIFSNQFAPKKTSIEASDILGTTTKKIRLSQFNPGGINESINRSNLFIDVIKNTVECNVPDYDQSCSLMPPNTTMATFNLLSIVMSGAPISFVMGTVDTGIRIIYKNVDLLASGPPDVLFDPSSSESKSGSSLEAAWRFGSQGPEIYESILVGIPYNESEVDENAPISVLLDKLYDEDWNVIWNADTNTTANLPSDYSDFNTTWFNKTTGGMPCSKTDKTADCYANTTNNMIWISIPHFSGVGPTVKSVTIGNVTLNTSSDSYECRENCSVYINVTNGNYTLSQSLQNITINNTDTTGNVIWFKIYKYDGSAFVLNGTNSTTHINYNFTLYNGSPETVHQYRIDINKSTNAFTQWNFTYDVSGLSEPLVLTINLTCTPNWNCTSWSSCSGGTQTRTCIDINNCTATNERVESRSCSTGGGGGGGSSSATITKAVDLDITPKVTKTLRKFGIISFKCKHKIHTLTMQGVDSVNKKVTITIASTPKTYEINLGETIKVDTDGNGYNDLAITFDEIILTSAKLTLENIAETPVKTLTTIPEKEIKTKEAKTESQPTKEPAKETKEPAKEPAKKPVREIIPKPEKELKLTWIIIAGIIILFAAFSWLFKGTKKKKKKK